MQQGLQRRLADAQMIGQFAVTPVLGVLQQQDFAVAAGQPVQGLADHGPAFIGQQPTQGVLAGRGAVADMFGILADQLPPPPLRPAVQ